MEDKIKELYDIIEEDLGNDFIENEYFLIYISQYSIF